MIKKILILSLFITSGLLGLANDQVRFVGVGKQVVKVGDRFRVVYEINQDADNFRSPNFGSLKVLSGPSTSTNSSIQYVNGKMSQNYTMTYTFVVQATKVGEVLINEATAIVNRKQVKSNKIKIKVVKNTGNKQGSKKQANTGILQDDDVYIKAIISNRSPYIGEQVILTYKIYTKVPVSNLMVKKLSSFQGFWSKNLLEDNQQYNQKTEIINGEEYIVAEINKFAIFPQKLVKLLLNQQKWNVRFSLKLKEKEEEVTTHLKSFLMIHFLIETLKR